MTHRIAISIALSFITTVAHAQMLEPFGARIDRDGTAGARDILTTIGAVLPDGDVITAIRTDGSLTIGPHRIHVPDDRAWDAVVLARVAPDGVVRWVRTPILEAPPSALHLRGVTFLLAAPDEGFFVGGHLMRLGENGNDSRPGLLRFDADGNELWRMTPAESTNGASFEPVLARDGRLFVFGQFARQPRFQIAPGFAAWFGRADRTYFVAEVGLADGRVLRAERDRQSAWNSAAPDGGLVAASEVRGDLEIVIRNTNGRVIRRFSWGSPLHDTVRGMTVLADGAIAMLVYSWRSYWDDPYRELRLVIHEPNGRVRASVLLPPIGDAALLDGDLASSIAIAIPHDFHDALVDRNTRPLATRARLLTFDAHGGLRGARDVQFGGLEILSQTIRGSIVDDQALLTGVSAAPIDDVATYTESFHVRVPLPWQDMRATARAQIPGGHQVEMQLTMGGTPETGPLLPPRPARPWGPLERAMTLCECNRASFTLSTRERELMTQSYQSARRDPSRPSASSAPSAGATCCRSFLPVRYKVT